MAATDFDANAIAGGVDVTITRPGRGPVTLGWIAIVHGLNGSAAGSMQGKTWGTYPQYLGDIGYGLIGCDMPNWPGPTSRSRLDALWTYYQTLPDKASTWHMLAVSDGGGQTLDWLPVGSNAAKVGRVRLHNPLTDVRLAYGLAGYTPAYSTGGVTRDPSWPADMDANFSGSWPTNSPGYRINDNTGVIALQSISTRIEIAQAPDDASLPPNAAGWLVGQVNRSTMTLRAGGGLAGGHANQGSYPDEELEAFYRGWTA